MARGVNKVICEDEFDLYLDGHSIPEVSEELGIPQSTLRFRYKKAGILRGRTEGVRLAASKGKLSHMLGAKREFSEEWKANIAKARLNHGKLFADSVKINSKGYCEFTRGKHKGRQVHNVVMELFIGRKMQKGECVHHIDGDKKNNDIGNLAFMTLSAHASIHRLQENLSGIQRRRNANGTWG